MNYTLLFQFQHHVAVCGFHFHLLIELDDGDHIPFLEITAGAKGQRGRRMVLGIRGAGPAGGAHRTAAGRTLVDPNVGVVFAAQLPPEWLKTVGSFGMWARCGDG